MRTTVMAVALAAAANSGWCGLALHVPPAPTAIPGNSQVALSWPEVPGAKSYNVYYASTLPVTKKSSKISVQGTSTSIGNLSNGTPYYFAVTAIHGYWHGESPLSSTGCAVPTAANTAGLRLFDALCGEALDGQKWLQPGAISRGVANGAAEFSVNMVNQESQTIRGSFYNSQVNVNRGTRRVTTLQADILVPSCTASRTGDSQIRSYVQLVYMPPSKLPNAQVFPGSYEDLLLFQVGLMDSGRGLRAYRLVAHCDNAACSPASDANIAFMDPPGFVGLGVPPLVGSPAKYDTSYTASVRLDETTGVFHWSIAGGRFGAGVSGTADPSAYLASNPDWSGAPLAGAGFVAAQMGVRTLDASPDGGGSGRITGRFRNVQVGFDDGTTGLWDDFSGAGTNSGPTTLSPLKWVQHGAVSSLPSAGSLVERIELHQPAGSTLTYSQAAGISVAFPEGIETFQADVLVPSPISGSTKVAFLPGRFYNDGSAAAEPYSLAGDVWAQVQLYPSTNEGRFYIAKCTNFTCSTSTTVGYGAIPVSGTVLDNVHTLRIGFSKSTKQFTFAVDGNSVVVNPQVQGPFVQHPAPYSTAARGPRLDLSSVLFVSPTTTPASMSTRFNNVYVGP